MSPATLLPALQLLPVFDLVGDHSFCPNPQMEATLSKLKSIRFASATHANFPTGISLGESQITGELALQKLLLLPNTLADARIAQSLLQEDSQQTLNFFLREIGVSSIDFFGTIFMDQEDKRYVLRLYREKAVSVWNWKKQYLSSRRTKTDRALTLII